MLANPRIGLRVQVWYGKRSRDHMPLHAEVVTVRGVARGRPRNIQVQRADGRRCIVPCGNIRKTESEA